MRLGWRCSLAENPRGPGQATSLNGDSPSYWPITLFLCSLQTQVSLGSWGLLKSGEG